MLVAKNYSFKMSQIPSQSHQSQGGFGGSKVFEANFLQILELWQPNPTLTKISPKPYLHAPILVLAGFLKLTCPGGLKGGRVGSILDPGENIKSPLELVRGGGGPRGSAWGIPPWGWSTWHT